MHNKIRYDVQGPVATLTLDDMATRNALADDTLDELLTGLARIGEDDEIRVVVLRSADPKVFSSGGNLKSFIDDRPIMEKYAGLDRFPRLYEAIAQIGKPVICAAEGDVLAGAFGLALACDFIVAADGVKFGCPEINVGVFPFMLSSPFYRCVPRSTAHQVLITAA